MFGKAPPPWGNHQFQPAHTYAPNFHQPRQLHHLDTNSRLDIDWDASLTRARNKAAQGPGPVPPAQPCERAPPSQGSETRSTGREHTTSNPMVLEMQDTLAKINTLLSELQTRSSERKPRSRSGTTTVTTAEDTTITSCLDSVSKEVSDLTTRTEQLTELTPGRKDGGRKKERSTDSAATTAPESLPTEQPTAAEEGPRKSGKRRQRILTDRSTTSTFYRGSEASRGCSLHQSSFGSIAELSGYAEDRIARPRQRRPSAPCPGESGGPFTGEGKYYSEYPPQRGSAKFNGFFADEISALFDESARGLITL